MTTHLPPDGSGINWSIAPIPGEAGMYHIKTEQDEKPLLDYNQSLRNSGYTGNLTFGRHLAHVLPVLWNRWVNENPEIKAGKAHPDYEKTLMRLLKENPKCLVVNEKFGAVR